MLPIGDARRNQTLEEHYEILPKFSEEDNSKVLSKYNYTYQSRIKFIIFF